MTIFYLAFYEDERKMLLVSFNSTKYLKMKLAPVSRKDTVPVFSNIYSQCWGIEEDSRL